MKRFAWRLQRVLEIKKKEEQKERAELLRLTERLAGRRGELVMRQMMLRDVIDGLAAVDPKKRLGEQEFFLRHAGTSDEHIRKLKDRVSELELQQKQKIAEVLKIRRLKEGLEKLRDEAKRQFIAEQEKFEQKELDEMATVSFVRKALS
jgi:flagellar biosynthesis chaperone FliJ